MNVVDESDVCPVCQGNGNDPEGCGCQCFSPEEEKNCVLGGCQYCNCAGCGGSCLYCGGSGRKSDWQPGGPYPQDVGSAQVDEGARTDQSGP